MGFMIILLLVIVCLFVVVNQENKKKKKTETPKIHTTMKSETTFGTVVKPVETKDKKEREAEKTSGKIKMSPSSPPDKKAEKKANMDNHVIESLMVYRPQERRWACRTCGTENTMSADSCWVCKERK